MSKLDSSLPVAMFDSGVGGLTVLHECLVSLPQEDFLYLGDTAMFPYGSRDPERLRERIAAIAELLLDRGAGHFKLAPRGVVDPLRQGQAPTLVDAFTWIARR